MMRSFCFMQGSGIEIENIRCDDMVLITFFLIIVHLLLDDRTAWDTVRKIKGEDSI